MNNISYKTKMCFAEFKGFAPLCLCRRVRIRNFVFPALVTAFSPRALLGFDVFKLRRVPVRKVPIVILKSLKYPSPFPVVSPNARLPSTMNPRLRLIYLRTLHLGDGREEGRERGREGEGDCFERQCFTITAKIEDTRFPIKICVMEISE